MLTRLSVCLPVGVTHPHMHMQVVKLLLAAYVQSLSAGAEVMAAGRGQWGSAHTGEADRRAGERASS
jgi:hypothetical protein